MLSGTVDALHETERVSRKLFTFADTVAQDVARRHDLLRIYDGCLRRRGLLDDADVNQSLQWFRERLRRVLAICFPVATAETEQGAGS